MALYEYLIFIVSAAGTAAAAPHTTRLIVRNEDPYNQPAVNVIAYLLAALGAALIAVSIFVGCLEDSCRRPEERFQLSKTWKENMVPRERQYHKKLWKREKERENILKSKGKKTDVEEVKQLKTKWAEEDRGYEAMLEIQMDEDKFRETQSWELIEPRERQARIDSFESKLARVAESHGIQAMLHVY